MDQFYVYIMTNATRTLYAGMANDLVRRVYGHKHKLAEGFAKKHNITWLVYYQVAGDAESALSREKQIKGWLRVKRSLSLKATQN